MTIVAVLALLALQLPAQPKSRVSQATCANNLRQVGQAIQMFADENADYLPPGAGSDRGLLIGQQSSYTSSSWDRLAYYVAPFMGTPPPSAVRNEIKALVCPGFERYNDQLVTETYNRTCYGLNDGNTAGDTNNVSFKPFGYPSGNPSPPEAPHTLAEIQALRPLSLVHSIIDIDKVIYTNLAYVWIPQLPTQPVHGKTRNALYFDGHVGAREVGPPGTR